MLDPIDKPVLRYIAEHGPVDSAGTIRRALELSRCCHSNVRRLIRSGFVTIDEFGEGYVITPEGQEALNG